MTELSRQELERRVMQVTMEVLSLDGPPPPRESRIVEDLGADSIDQFSLVSALECEFGGAIEEEDMESLQTLGDVIDFIHAEARRQAQAGAGPKLA